MRIISCHSHDYQSSARQVGRAVLIVRTPHALCMCKSAQNFICGRCILLQYLMIGYIFLARTALEPLSCAANLDGKKYIATASAADIECSWCHTQADDQRMMSYRTLASLAVVAYTVYGLGTPLLFLLILTTNKLQLHTNVISATLTPSLLTAPASTCEGTVPNPALARSCSCKASDF